MGLPQLTGALLVGVAGAGAVLPSQALLRVVLQPLTPLLQLPPALMRGAWWVHLCPRALR